MIPYNPLQNQRIYSWVFTRSCSQKQPEAAGIAAERGRFQCFPRVSLASGGFAPGYVPTRSSPHSPMSLTSSDVQRLATLARIELDAEEAARTLEQLNAVFDLIEKLQAVDTTGVAPMTHARDLALRLREDRVTESDRRADYQAVAPAVERGLYLVPRVIE